MWRQSPHLSSGDARLVAIPVAFGVIADIGQNAEIVTSDPERHFELINCCGAQLSALKARYPVSTDRKMAWQTPRERCIVSLSGVG